MNDLLWFLAGLLVGFLIWGAGIAHAGAWGDIYDYGDVGAEGTPRALAIVALKRELTYRGFGKNLTDEPSFGDAMRNRVREFQEAQELIVTGKVGPDTSRRLFRKRVYSVEDSRGIPNHLECRLLNLESGYDPAAVGYSDPRDRGLAQINGFFHPDVDDFEAFDPRFSIPWAGRWLQSAYVYFSSRTDTPWRAAVIAYNKGFGGAQAWIDAGRPTDSSAGVYLSLVLSRPC